MFRYSYSHLKANALFSLHGIFLKTKSLGSLPPNMSFTLFDTLVKPILLYCSEIWGTTKVSYSEIEKVHLQILRTILGVKMSTCKLALYGDTGRYQLQ